MLIFFVLIEKKVLQQFSLHRERYGMLEVTDLASGEYRALRHDEVQYLKNGRQMRKSSGRL